MYARWHREFAAKDVVVIGVHTPELEEERVVSNVYRHIKLLGIEYPVLLDQEWNNWNRWRQQYWPAIYLIDKQGQIRYRWAGELNYGGAHGEALMTARIEELLAEP